MRHSQGACTFAFISDASESSEEEEEVGRRKKLTIEASREEDVFLILSGIVEKDSLGTEQ